MTQFRKLARATLLAAAACVSAFAFASIGLPAVAEAKKAKATPAAQSAGDSKLTPDEQKKKASRQAYDAGLKDFANGRYPTAVDQLSLALKTGGLSSTEMAKALYTRGAAYRRQKQPGLAISDLTSALWLKNGLSASDREAATAERAEAYKIAGVQDAGKGPERVVGAPSPAASSKVAAMAAPGPNAGSAGLSAAAIAQAAANSNASETSGSSSQVSRQDPSSSAAQDAARARAAYAPVNSLAATPGVSGSGPQAAQISPAPAQSSSFGSSVTGFFSNIFGGSSAAPAGSPQTQAPAGVTTASTGPVAETSSWSNSTVVTEGHSAKKTRKAAASKTARATKGKYKVHIAALRSRAEAEALAQQLVAQHGADLDNHVPTVDEAVIGSMGTFYRVRISGYASQDEPRGLCTKLRSSGLDCLVVTN